MLNAFSLILIILTLLPILLILIFRALKSARTLKQNNERFRILVEQSPFVFQIYSPDGICFYANPAWERFWEISRKDIEGYNIFKDPQGSPEAQSLMRRAFQGETITLPDIDYDPSKVGKAGRPRWIRIHFFPIKKNDGTIREVVQINEDVTDSKKLIETQKEGIRVRDEFLTIASHELNTPLTTMRLLSRSARRRIDKKDPAFYQPESINQFVERYQVQTERMVHLVEDMLEISRINSGQTTLQREPLNLHEIVTLVLERNASAIEHSKSVISVTGDWKVTGDWDRKQIEKMISGLLSNALKYGEKAPIEISIEQKENQAVLAIKDHGIGIASKDQKRIFDRFERAISANQVSGFGLGLYIIQRIATEHGGSVHLESESGRGSTFTVELPLKPGRSRSTSIG